MKLLIIDVQTTYIEFAMQDSLLQRIEKLSENYDDIIYLWDNISGQELLDEVPEEWLADEYDNDGEVLLKDSFYSKFNKIISKEYGFIRNFMDNSDFSKEDIIKLGKFFIKNNITDGRDIEEDEENLNNFKKQFKNNANILNADFNSLIFYLPYDLIEDLRLLEGSHLVGGGRNECLEEVSILMDILDINHSILEEYCY